MFQLFVSFRYLRSKLISDLCLAGLAVGVAVLVIVNSVMSGFTGEFGRRLQGTQAHLQIEGTEHLGLSSYPLMAEMLGLDELQLRMQTSEESAFVAGLIGRNGLPIDARTAEPFDPPSLIGRVLREDPAGLQLLNALGETLLVPPAMVVGRARSPVKSSLPYLSTLAMLTTELEADAGVLRAQNSVEASRLGNFGRYLLSPGAAYQEAYGRYYEPKLFGSTFGSSLLLNSLWRQGAIEAEDFERLERAAVVRSFQSLETYEQYVRASGVSEAEVEARANELHKHLGPVGHVLVDEGFGSYEQLLAASQGTITGFEELLQPGPELIADPDRIFSQTRSGMPGVIVGIDLFGKMDLALGQVLRLSTVKPRADGEYDSLKRDFEVIGTYHSGFGEADGRLMFCSEKVLRELLEIPPEIYSGVELMVESFEQARELKPAIARRLASDLELLGSYRLVTWDEKNRTLIEAVQLEKWVLSLILLFMMAVAGLILLVILMMMVNERVRDVGVMKAIGATTQGVLGTFLVQGFFIGVSGAVVGLVLGLLATWNINSIVDFVYLLTGYHPFPRSIFSFDKIPVDVRVGDILFIVVPMILTSLLLSLYPAWLASRQNPIEALRRDL